MRRDGDSDIPSCVTEGDTLEEAMAKAATSAMLYRSIIEGRFRVQ